MTKILADGRFVPDSTPTRMQGGKLHALSAGELAQRQADDAEHQAIETAREAAKARREAYDRLGDPNDHLAAIWRALAQLGIVPDAAAAPGTPERIAAEILAIDNPPGG